MANFFESVEKTLGLNPQTKDILINSQIPKFRGYGKNGNIELGNNINLDLEDPSYIIFDVNIDIQSALFNQVRPFLDKYGQDSMDVEIKDAGLLYDEFIKTLKLIFPIFGDKADVTSGNKRHYINSISGLDILNKPIINYPEDKLTFKLSEDVTMFVQYLSELYSNLTYSFATNRQLIPSNLLLFNMYIILSDVRDMKKGLKKVGKNYADEISEDKSKFIYVMHDCEFNFFSSKLHTDEVVVGGYSQGPTTTPSTLNLSMNFKSYSRILSASLLKFRENKNGERIVGDSAYLLDYRLKKDGFSNNGGKLKKLEDDSNTYINGDGTVLPVYEDFYRKFNNDYKTQEEFEEKNKKRYNVNGIDPTDPPTSPKGYFNKLATKGLNTIKGVGSSMVNKLYNEVDILKGTIQKGIGTALGVNLTLTKINVYFETPEEKMERLALLTSNITNNIGRNINKAVENGLKDLGNVGGNSNRLKNTSLGSVANDIGKDALNGLTGTLSGKNIRGEFYDTNIYKRDIESDYTRSGKNINYGVDDNDKLPSRGQNETYKVGDTELYYLDNKLNDTYKTNLYEDENSKTFEYKDKDGKTVTTINHYNEKHPEGDLHTNGTYNEKYPEGDLHNNGTYNKKYPTDILSNKNITIGNTGDLYPDGTYNKKEPDDENNYGRKPNQDYTRSGKSMNKQSDDNDKKPTDILSNKNVTIGNTGDLHPNGTYNEKYPSGDRHTSGTYNEKYPSGDRQPNGTYNEKYPSGDLHPNGTYNEKYPSGDLHPSGTYNEKFPEGDLHPSGTYNEKYPEGDLHPNGTYNEKYPSGDVHLSGIYNEKYPSGDLQPKGTYNEKFPEGDLHPSGTYNEKYPDGDKQPNGTYNEKYPDGDLQPKGTYNEKYPSGDKQPNGTYNEKYPDGDRQSNGTYNEKYPEGDRQPNGKYNEKHPSGRLNSDGTYNEKYPEGDRQPNGQYNIKFPEGDKQPNGIYNEKHPSGNRQPNGKYNEKHPSGDRQSDGQYNIKFPNDENVYLKNNKRNR